jgi:hypothetical protein
MQERQERDARKATGPAWAGRRGSGHSAGSRGSVSSHRLSLQADGDDGSGDELAAARGRLRPRGQQQHLEGGAAMDTGGSLALVSEAPHVI